MTDTLTPIYRSHLLRLARDDGAPGAREARQELTAHGLTWTGARIKAHNRMVNSANAPNLTNAQRNGRLAKAGVLPDMFLPTKKVVHKNRTASPAGRAAIARAAQRKKK